MPDSEAPAEYVEPSSSRTSIVDSLPSESESLTLSDYEYEINVSQSPVSSSSESELIIPSYTLSPIEGYERIRIPLEHNLNQMLVRINLFITFIINMYKEKRALALKQHPIYLYVTRNDSITTDMNKLHVDFKLLLQIKITETEDLESVTSLRLRVIASDFSLQRVPVYLPHLTELNLDGSALMSLRDLGCDMNKLKILRVKRTGINSLDGISSFPLLIELYAGFNNIKNVSPCFKLTQIEVLDLKKSVTKLQFIVTMKLRKVPVFF